MMFFTLYIRNKECKTINKGRFWETNIFHDILETKNVIQSRIIFLFLYHKCFKIKPTFKIIIWMEKGGYVS